MLKEIAGAAIAAAMIDTAIAQNDPYIWLEEIEGEEALDWVRAQNAQSLSELEADPRFDDLYTEALSVLTSDARLPLGAIHHGDVYNFWQDDEHIRGVWRRASVDSYRTGEPAWEIVLDIDALAEAEDENWIRGSTSCLSPAYEHCMVELSYGGKDAGVWREFNTKTKAFVENGFFIPEAKSSVAWIDKDTLVVGTDWGEGALTDSGYAREIRIWKRGEALNEAAPYFTGEKTDVSVSAQVEQTDDGPIKFVRRSVTFFEREYFIDIGAGDVVKAPLPLKASFQGVLDGSAVFLLREPWAFDGANYAQGTLIAYDLATKKAELIFQTSDAQSIEGIGVGKTNIVVQYLEDVSGKAARFSRTRTGKWKSKEINLPANGVVELVSAGGGTDDAMLSFESMTTPDSLFYVSAKNKVSKIFETPPFFDATGISVEQRFATSNDGAQIPYFVMGQDSVLKQGNAPTIQYGYGGFLIPILPVYYNDPARPQNGALAGLSWVKRGGVMVLSNIRGGSEYGPRWHEAALKENRQRGFDDFIAISEHLIETGVTSPEKLGAIGRSNGGLLMGAILTQRPELYAAIDIGVPLFDMKRYNKLLAGASWMGEYGNPDIPEEWAYISQYSPYQKLAADAGYPKVLFYTSTKDDRVHPGHARKAAAKMADLGYDFYYYENIEGGHGGTANQEQLAHRTALEYVYFVRQLMGQAE